MPSRDFQTWIVRQIAARDTSGSREILQTISKNATLAAGLRYEAEASLKSMQARKPSE